MVVANCSTHHVAYHCSRPSLATSGVYIYVFFFSIYIQINTHKSLYIHIYVDRCLFEYFVYIYIFSEAVKTPLASNGDSQDTSWFQLPSQMAPSGWRARVGSDVQSRQYVRLRSIDSMSRQYVSSTCVLDQSGRGQALGLSLGGIVSTARQASVSQGSQVILSQ